MNKFIRKEEEKKVKRGEKRGKNILRGWWFQGCFRGVVSGVVVVVVVSYMSCG